MCNLRRNERGAIMPFYDYKCSSEDCKHVMQDQLRKMSETAIECDQCGEKADRMFSGRFAAHGLPNGHNAVRVRG